MQCAWRCLQCRGELGTLARDDAGRATLIVWTDTAVTVRPLGRDFEVTCPCGHVRVFYGGWLRFSHRTKAA